MRKESELEQLKKENEMLKQELEISKLRKENRELRKQIDFNNHAHEGTYTYKDYTPYTTTPWTPDGKTTITLCSSNLSDSDKKKIMSNIKSFLTD